MTTLRITNGHVIDPACAVDRIADLWIRDDRIVGLGPRPDLRPDVTQDATGHIVCPGLIDMHVHLREPGREEDETIATGTAAALAGGVTSVSCMPNTEPPLDTPERIAWVRDRARAAGLAHVFPTGTVSRDRAGRDLVDIEAMLKAGAVAFTDDGSPVYDAALMRRALEVCGSLGCTVLVHAEIPELARGGVMAEGEVSRRLGVVGVPGVAEDVMIYRDIALARLTQGRVHILHVSTAEGVDLIRRGKESNVRVTGEACPHHFLLTDEAVAQCGPDARMAPPLRTSADVAGILEGLRDGTLEVIATDHAPHAPAKKARGLLTAPNGIVGLETLLPLCVLGLIETGVLTWPQLIAKLTINPARILGLDRGTLRPGAVADVTVIDPKAPWVIDPAAFRTRSRNTPFAGWRVRGRVETVVVAGRVFPRADA